MRTLRLIAPLALIVTFGGFAAQSARADGPGYGPPSRVHPFKGDFRPGFPHRHGHFRDDFRRHHNPRFCSCGFDFHRHRGHHHHHHDRFDRFPRLPHRGHF